MFLTLLFASMLLVVSVFTMGAYKLASRNYVNAAFDLAGRSILSEYNIMLMEEYGIFAMRADPKNTEDKLTYYVENSFNKKNNRLPFIPNKKSLDPLKLDLQQIEVDLKEHSIINVDLLESQILEYAKYEMAATFLSDKVGTASNVESQAELKNEKIIKSLPSYGYKGSSIQVDKILETGIPTMKEIYDKGKDRFFVDEYLIGIFQNHRKANETRKTFFTNEVEYILCGELNDHKNFKGVQRLLLFLRSGLNLAHIYSDPEKREEVIALASVITPGPGAVATQLVIAAAWSGAEGENDIRLLLAGKKVALIKKNTNWALDLEGVMDETGVNGFIEPESNSGIDYEDYLRILLFFQNRETKLLRTMDLIELNMKGNYHRDFAMKDYYGGFKFEAMVNDQKYSFVQKY